MSSATPDVPGAPRALSTLIAFAAVCTAASMGAINPYRYGVADHVLTIPFLKQWIDPSLYAGDLIVPEKVHLYTVLWPLLALVVRGTGLPIESVFLWGYALSVFATFIAIGVLARTMASSTSAGLLAMFIAVFAKETLAGAATIEDNFLTRVVALPFALFAFADSARERHVRAAMLLGIAFVVHPLTGLYAAAMAATAGLVAMRHRRPVSPLASVVVFLLLASPVLIWKALDPVRVPVIPEAEWMALLELRAPHHIAPLTWSPLLYIATAALVAVVFACAPRTGTGNRGGLLQAASVGALGLFVIALVFGTFVPLSPVVQLQLFRASAFLAYFAIVAYSGCLVGAAHNPLSLSELATLWLFGFAVLYGAQGWPFALAAIGVVIAGVSAYRRVVGLALPPEALSLLLIALLFGLSLGAARTSRAGVGSDAPEADWVELQHWARASTPRDAVFIVPPGHDGFRIESERSIYGDWKDGTQGFFNDAVGREWLARMERLGFRRELPVRGLNGMDVLDDAYRKLDARRLHDIADDIVGGPSKVYIVDFADSQRLGSVPIYRNDHYAVFAGAKAPVAY